VLVRSPVVFVRLAEQQVGEYDMVYTAASLNGSSAAPFLNYTSMNASLSAVDGIFGAAPRWVLVGDVGRVGDSGTNASVVLLIIDTDLEQVRAARPRAHTRVCAHWTAVLVDWAGPVVAAPRAGRG
jgi:hypothetical protein